MTITEQIEQLKEMMRIREIADDGYYISRQYKEDCEELHQLMVEIKKQKKQTKTKR